MSHMQESLIFLVVFTFWLIRLYYKLYDKKIRFYVLVIGILIIFWMVISLIKGLLYSTNQARFCWYLYYISLIFAPSYFYICVCSFSKNISRRNKIITYTISSILLCLVLTNDFHQFVFKFPNGFSDYDNYKHYIGYYIICFHIFYLYFSGMFSLAINQFKSKKHLRAFLPLLLLVIGFMYTIFYVMNVPFFRESNLSVILSMLICLGIELILFLGLIPNNSKYKKTFINSSLDMLIISLDSYNFYGTKSFGKVPLYIENDIKNDSVKNIYKRNNVIYDVIFNKDSYVVFKRDITIFNNLKKKTKSRQRKLLAINSKLKNENEIKRELDEIKLRKEIVLKLEQSMYEKKKEALTILDRDNLKKEDLEYIKVLISYCKRKSSLIISELNYDLYSSLEIKMLILELFIDFKINGEVIVKNMCISSYDISVIYDVVFEVLKKCENTNIILFVSLENNNIKLRFMMDKNIDTNELLRKISFKKYSYKKDLELVYSFKRSDIL